MNYKLYTQLLFITLLLNACAVAVPTHQVNGPQTLGKGAFELSILSGTAPAVGPKFETGTPPSQNVSESLNEMNIIQGARLGIGIAERLDLELEALLSFFGGTVASGGLKFQWLGQSLFAGKAGSWNSALRAKYISASGFKDDPNEQAGGDTIFDNVFVEKMDAGGFSVGNAFGYQVTDWFQVYLGGQYINMTLDYRYREDNSMGTLYQGKRSIEGYGPFAGLQLNTTGSGFRFVYTIEYDYTNLPSTHFEKKVWYDTFSGSMMFAFDL